MKTYIADIRSIKQVGDSIKYVLLITGNLRSTVEELAKAVM